MFNNKLLMEETENSNLIKKDENKIKQPKKYLYGMNNKN